ncbi:MAG TPA: hypothetical protein VHM02_12960, partial [Thermoanaerobaculia bacterium]|nr:hypothetical protein [Thermoanaerobaculia bacterium]
GLRLAATGGAFDVEFDSERVTYEGEAELASALATVDLHPFAGGFRLSLGALVNDNTLSGEAPIRDLLLDEGIAVPPGIALGELVAEATVEPVAPYAGIGWGSAPGGGGWSLSLDLGAAWHGEPEVDLEVQGPLAGLAGRPEVVQAIAEEERELEAELEDYSLFPVVALSLSYRF